MHLGRSLCYLSSPERQAELQHSLDDLHKALDLTRLGRDQDQQVLQQEVEERDRLIQSLNEDNQRLHRLLLVSL